MQTFTSKFKSNTIKSLLTVSLLLFATAAKSTVVSMDFDSVNALGGPVDATSYLASYGVTLASVSNPVYIFDDRNFYGSGAVAATSPHSFLLQQVSGSPNGITYTLDFSTPLSQLSFTRIAQITSNSIAQWTAMAYDGATAVGSVGESFYGGTEGAQTFTLSSHITSLTFVANGYNYAGVSSAPIDNFVMTQAVPEPGSWSLMLLGLTLIGAIAKRRRV